MLIVLMMSVFAIVGVTFFKDRVGLRLSPGTSEGKGDGERV